MSKSELEISKKIAEIEGLDAEIKKTCYPPCCELLIRSDSLWIEYNPFDWQILWALLIKYGVNINRASKEVYITKGWTSFRVSFNADKEIPRAILECIIKSQEK